MTARLPFKIETIAWSDLSETQRCFFVFQDEYLPLPGDHALQIHRLTSESAQRVCDWLGPSLPAGWPESKPYFANQSILRLGHDNWNTDDGVQNVRQWLHDLGVAYSSEVFLLYDRKQVVRMPWKLVVKYWDALAWSIGYAMTVMDHTQQWACCFHHEDAILYGAFSEGDA